MQIEDGVVTPTENCIIVHTIRKPNSIIVLLFIQNILRAFKRTKCTLWSFVTNCKADNIQ